MSHEIKEKGVEFFKSSKSLDRIGILQDGLHYMVVMRLIWQSIFFFSIKRKFIRPFISIIDGSDFNPSNGQSISIEARVKSEPSMPK